MSEKLLPCPFCGIEADYVGQPRAGYRVQCRGCLAQSGWGDYGYQVEQKWNTRAALAEPAPAPLAGREEIARIIDPSGMSDGIRLRWALEKADAILALSPHERSGRTKT